MESDHGKGQLKVPFKDFINPVIVEYTKEKIGFYHGCLSAEGYDMAKMATYKKILVAYYDENFQIKVEKLDNLATVIWQHEFYHLAQQDTYVGAIEWHIKNNPNHKRKQFYSTLEKIKADENRLTFKKVGNEIPSLLNMPVLAKAYFYPTVNEPYKEAIKLYLRTNPQDRILYKNFISMKHATQIFPLYSSSR